MQHLQFIKGQDCIVLWLCLGLVACGSMQDTVLSCFLSDGGYAQSLSAINHVKRM